VAIVDLLGASALRRARALAYISFDGKEVVKVQSAVRRITI